MAIKTTFSQSTNNAWEEIRGLMICMKLLCFFVSHSPFYIALQFKFTLKNFFCILTTKKSESWIHSKKVIIISCTLISPSSTQKKSLVSKRCVADNGRSLGDDRGGRKYFFSHIHSKRQPIKSLSFIHWTKNWLFLRYVALYDCLYHLPWKLSR